MFRFYITKATRAGFTLALTLLVGCATTEQTREAEADKQARVAAILTDAPERADYAESKRCLDAHQYRHIQILDSQHIVFEGRRNQYWLNRLPARCPGLRRGSTIALKPTANRLCKLDTIAVYDWFDWPWYRRWPFPWGSGPMCSLGEFQPITAPQVNALKAALAGP